MPPAERGGRMDAAQFLVFARLFALDHRLGVSEHLPLLAQMRHGRSGQACSGIATARPSGPSRRSRDPRNAGSPGFPPAQRLSFQARPPSAWRVAFPVKARLNLPARRRSLPPSLALARLPRVAPRSGPRSPPANPESPEPHQITSSTRRDLTETIDNAIRAGDLFRDRCSR